MGTQWISLLELFVFCLQFDEVTEADLQYLYQLAHQSECTNIRVHTVRTVATIGCMLAKHTPPHLLMKASKMCFPLPVYAEPVWHNGRA